MTPAEKAKKLVDKYRDTIISFLSDNMKDMNAKECALIAVDEILSEHMFDDSDYANRQYKYWQQVKQEIEKL